MRKCKQYYTALCLGIIMLIIIIDTKSAVLGAQEGLQLCLSTVIPSLFPFIVISIMLIGSLQNLPFPFLNPLEKLMHLPRNSGILFLIGILGGYPVGAQNVLHAYKNGMISKKDAERILPFCNNAGPAFIFGIGANIFDRLELCWIAWSILIISSVIVGSLSAKVSEERFAVGASTTIALSDALHRATKVLASICGWIILFRVMISYYQEWVIDRLPTNTQILFYGILELSNGCCSLVEISSQYSQFIMFCVMLSFGGVCVAMQSKTIVRETDLSFRFYFPGKFAQASISYLLCTMVCPLIFGRSEWRPNLPIMITAITCCILYRYFSKKSKLNIAFDTKIMYNILKKNSGGYL